MIIKYATRCEICGKELPVGSEAEDIKDDTWSFYCGECNEIRKDADKFYDFCENHSNSREIKREMRAYKSEHNVPREVAEATIYRKYNGA